MGDVLNLDAAEGKNIIEDSDTACIELTQVSGNPSVAALKLGTSAASGAMIEISNALISTASATVQSFMIPVRHTSEDKIAYLVAYTIA
jgi:hypothetical protein